MKLKNNTRFFQILIFPSSVRSYLNNFETTSVPLKIAYILKMNGILEILGLGRKIQGLWTESEIFKWNQV